MELEKLLTSVPVEEWKTKQTVALGWYDGPTEGVCALVHPECEFYFELLDERFNPDDLDDRLYRLSEIPRSSVEAVQAALEELGRALNPVWVPVWKFRTEASRQHAEQLVDQVKSSRRPTSLVVYSQDMEKFLGCWTVEQTGQKETDWFSVLGIPQATPAVEE